MKDKGLPRTGVLTDKSRITFYLDDYCATFINTESSIYMIPQDNSFIFGSNYYNYNIAIHKGNMPIQIYREKRLKINAYIVATDNMLLTDWSGFECIVFKGGTLNQLFCCNAITTGKIADGTLTYKYTDDSLSFDIEIDGCKCELNIYSNVSEHFGFNGVALTNNIVHMSLKFSEKQPLNDVFKHISKIKELLSFMTFRQNIAFDEIGLYHNDKNISKMKVFVKELHVATEKKIHNNLTFYDIQECVPSLLSMFYNNKENKPSYEIGFIPSSDKDSGYMNNNKVRLICSALECELSFVDDLKVEEDAQLQILIKDIKDMVKKHRKGSNKLDSKTYDLIFGSINHWTMSVSDRICILYHRFEQEMLMLMPSDIHISDEQIQKFVKYRNMITHGSWKVLDEEVAITAYVLQGLVYCSILKRMGLSQEKITQLCQNNKLLY